MTSSVRRITKTILRGPYASGSDVISEDHTVLNIHTVRQGVENFTDRDYSIYGNTISWDKIGIEPSPGSEYTINYDYNE